VHQDWRCYLQGFHSPADGLHSGEAKFGCGHQGSLTQDGKMTLLTADNNFHTLATSLKQLQQEINTEKGEEFFKNDKLLTELFHAAEATTNKLFAINVSLTKSA
jgi:hypothetical protein